MQDGTFPRLGHLEETAAAEAGRIFAADCPTRRLLDRITDRWSLLILLVLGDGDLRFNALKRRIEGVSQKMLSQTLRSLERDGLVTREVRPTNPVSVLYGVTPLGRDLLSVLQPMIGWADRGMAQVAAARRDYDALAHARGG